MKKLLGVSIMAMLAVSPMMASAALDPASTAGANATVDAAVATAGYVKGAYNAAIGEINTVISEVNSLSQTVAGLSGNEGGIATAIQSNAQNGTFTPAANSSIENADTIAEAIEEVSSHADANATAIETLNSDASTTGSVANTAAAAVKTGAEDADFTKTQGSSITTATTVGDAIEEVSSNVDTLASRQLSYVDSWTNTTVKTKALGELPLP